MRFSLFLLGSRLVVFSAPQEACHSESCAADDTELGKTVLSPELQTLLWCNDLCQLGASDEDERLAASLARYSHGSKESKAHAKHVKKTCMWRCRKGDKHKEEVKGVRALEEYIDLPADLMDYHFVAERCISAGLRGVDDLPLAIETCGVAHLEAGHFNIELLEHIRSEYETLRAAAEEYNLRVDQKKLRGGREELWPPFRWPFNSTEFLVPDKLMPTLKHYLGPNVSFDHITILSAPAGIATEAQKIHADVNEARRHVEIHIPLTNITTDMGPTLFCPGSQAISQADDLKQLYFSFVNCSHDDSLSYTLPLRAGEVTLYDANTFHAGKANLAAQDRPVLQLSWAANPEHMQTRRYAERTFAGNSTRWNHMSADIEAFRRLVSASL